MTWHPRQIYVLFNIIIYHPMFTGIKIIGPSIVLSVQIVIAGIYSAYSMLITRCSMWFELQGAACSYSMAHVPCTMCGGPNRPHLSGGIFRLLECCDWAIGKLLTAAFFVFWGFSGLFDHNGWIARTYLFENGSTVSTMYLFLSSLLFLFHFHSQPQTGPSK